MLEAYAQSFRSLGGLMAHVIRYANMHGIWRLPLALMGSRSVQSVLLG